MASSPLSKCFTSPATKQEEESSKSIYQHIRDQLSNLPSVKGCVPYELSIYDDYFAFMPTLVSTLVAQQQFKARTSDVFLATTPKSGTTWLKSLLFATVYRDSPHYDPHRHLSSLSPHECVPFLEFHVYVDDKVPDLDLLPSPRLFATHVPFRLLPNSVIPSGCKIVYMCRNPKDNIVSLWHFINKNNSKNGVELLPLDQALDRFCNGHTHGGLFWDHVLAYWNASLERPEQVMFVRYEDFMKDPVAELKRVAEFVGCPFTKCEERDGVVQDIVALCGFENLHNLEVNKNGKTWIVGFENGIENNMFFRKGRVGDWENYLTPEMGRRLDKITEDKFKDRILQSVDLVGDSCVNVTVEEEHFAGTEEEELLEGAADQLL